ncbi:MAG: aquaporin [Chloroflexi bacterium]|nr:aquaporin [Chloroflexota bacterium]
MGSSLRLYVVEFIGPFALMFLGGGAIIATGGKDLVAIALAHGLAIGLMVAAAGHISGGVYNPAITVGLWAAGKLPPARAIGYIVAQCLGSAFAALLLVGLSTPKTFDVAAVSLGVPALGPGVTVGQGLLAEIVMTFFLMFVIYGTAVDPRGARAIAPLAIGLTITMDVLAGGSLTGAAMNPSRAFGPALVGSLWADQWLYWVGPIVGAVIAALLYAYVVEERPAQEPKRAKAVA